MRKINKKPIFVFLMLFTSTTIGAIFAVINLLHFIPLGEYKNITKISLSILMIFLFNILVYRLFLLKFPLIEGAYKEDTKEDFIYSVYALYYLLLFNSVIYSLMIPIPIMRSIYMALGARFGKNTYCAGVILDPPFVHLGNDTIIGYDSVLCPHSIEGMQLSFSKIKMGNNVTIGMKSIIMAGVTIEDHGIVAAGSVVKKDTYIKTGEVWGGVPAKLLSSDNKHIQIDEIERSIHKAS